MPTILPGADLRDRYQEISELCHAEPEPVFITRDGAGDLVVMSIETYESLTGKLELYSLLDAGLQQAQRRQTRPLKDALVSIKARLNP